MAEFRCADAGATSCGWSASSEDEDELVEEVERHLRDEHRVEHVTRTLRKYARAVTRGET